MEDGVPEEGHDHGELPELPVEVWCKILLEYSTMKELIRFSAVQTSWKSIAKVIIPHQIPWLIVLPKPEPPIPQPNLQEMHQQFHILFNQEFPNLPNHQLPDALIQQFYNLQQILLDQFNPQQNPNQPLPHQIPNQQQVPNIPNDRHEYLLNLVDNHVYKFKFPFSLTNHDVSGQIGDGDSDSDSESDFFFVRTLSRDDLVRHDIRPNKRMKFSTYAYKNRKSRMKARMKMPVFGSNYGFYKWSDGIFNPFTKQSVWLPYLDGHVSCSDLTLLKLDDEQGSDLKDLCVAACINGTPAVWESRLCNAHDEKSRWWSFTGNYHIVGSLIEDTIIFKGCIYEILRKSLKIRVFDLKGGISKQFELKFHKEFTKSFEKHHYKFLVELGGDLLCILMNSSKVVFWVSRLDLDAIKWKTGNGSLLRGTLLMKHEYKVEDIGDFALFLSRHSSKALHVTNFVSRTIKKSSIYVMHPRNPHTLSIYSLSTGTVEPFVLDDDKFQIQVSPKLFSPWLMGKFWEDQSISKEPQNESEKIDGSALIKQRICSIHGAA